MILLLGGTAETAPLAQKLAEAGHAILVSTATAIALAVGTHPAIRRRQGRLDRESLQELLKNEAVKAVVDAAHPFAAELHACASEAAAAAGIPYLRYCRPALAYDGTEITRVADYEQAAREVCRLGSPVLLTIGARHLAPFSRAAQASGAELYARVLPEEASRQACLLAGLAEDHIVTGRGPFTVAVNRETLRRYGIQVLVSKESGSAGGLPEKIEAACLEGCRVVLIRQPPESGPHVFESFDEIVEQLTFGR